MNSLGSTWQIDFKVSYNYWRITPQLLERTPRLLHFILIRCKKAFILTVERHICELLMGSWECDCLVHMCLLVWRRLSVPRGVLLGLPGMLLGAIWSLCNQSNSFPYSPHKVKLVSNKVIFLDGVEKCSNEEEGVLCNLRPHFLSSSQILWLTLTPNPAGGSWTWLMLGACK